MMNSKLKDKKYEEYLKEELSNFYNYIEQISSFIFSIIRLIAYTLFYGTFLTVFTIISIYLLGEINLIDSKSSLIPIVVLSLTISFMVCLISNKGRFKNIFSSYARYSFEKKENFFKNLELQKSITEVVLIEHNLIKPPSIDIEIKDDKEPYI